MSNGRTLLILPCTDQKPYSKSRTWSYVLQKVSPWRERIDVAAIDCIRNPADKKLFGLVMEWEEWKTERLDERPSMDKIPELEKCVLTQLERMNGKYDRIVAYVNVKTYWNVLWKLRRKYKIKMLPYLFHDSDNWNSANANISPRGAFYKFIGELITTLDQQR